MRLLARLRRRTPEQQVVLDPADPGLVVLVQAPDPARADSEVLTEAAARGVDLTRPLLVRHHLLGLSPGAVAQAEAVLSQDGYVLLQAANGRHAAVRTQLLTALSVSQERARMAGLAARLGGDVAGWDALGHHL